MISLNKYISSFNAKICVLKETNAKNVKAFKLITNKKEAKAMAEHISCDCKRIFNSTIYNSN